MSDPLSLISGAITIINSVKAQYKKIGQLRFETIVAEMTGQLTKAKIEISALVEKNRGLENRVQELLEDRENPLVLNEKDNLYYRQDDEKYLFPFCQHCYEVDHLRIHLTKKYICPHCHTDFHIFSVHGLFI
jgi:hypothetical protein